MADAMFGMQVTEEIIMASVMRRQYDRCARVDAVDASVCDRDRRGDWHETAAFG